MGLEGKEWKMESGIYGERKKDSSRKKDEITMRVKNEENKEQRAQWHKKRPHRQNSCGDNSTGSIMTRWILFNLYVLYCWRKLFTLR